MQPRTKLGLIVGVIGLVLNICVAGFVGLCGPLFSLVAGGVAGFFAAQQEEGPTKVDGARAGATAGGIAGGLMILGQLIGDIGALAFLQSTGAQVPYGQIPSLSGDSTSQMIYYLIGALLTAGRGAGAGYLVTSENPVANPM